MAGLEGAHVVIVGAGLSGLTAAIELERRHARVEVVEARARLGGRTWTLLDPSGLHVEAGGEFVDDDHRALRTLCRACGVRLVPVLAGGFGMALDLGGRMRLRRSSGDAWRRFRRHLRAALQAYRDDGERDDGEVARTIAARSVAAAIADGGQELRAMADALRGLFVADPELLSALVIVQQLASTGTSMPTMARMKGGTARLIAAMRARLRGRVSTETIARAVRQTRSGVRVTLEDRHGRRREHRADYVVMTAPPPLVLECAFDPPLPAVQTDAYRTLPLGPATKVHLKFERPWWRRAHRPRAYSTNLPIGAVWDAGEDQGGAAVLTCLAGGASSEALRALVDARGADGVARDIRGLGRVPAATFVGDVVSWERDPWARGAYGVFTPAFDPRWRTWLGARHGRLAFAGEHTSREWQGFMNGAVESGQRAAEEVAALHDLASAGWSISTALAPDRTQQ